MGRSSTYSYVVNLVPQTVHSLRLRTARPPRLARVSTTRFSVASHPGQRTYESTTRATSLAR
jgi:hypothetical protein